ncbi:uncharacterized protein HMPREF1541_04509 [Cyphellophora europaea CBS 101466]|uniref:Nudix hydrolase domain-containing protein n=1 Tax=Cyphellophora europaea (strain CBS 101466) TaxID=1220924 RepID=W2RWR7_CYPE1|nr:uncharacterized protein HMPREF1541_04509 [Cyphellophora europaea CBS 101466]ETN40233.1 hypothetical protein HMPREF1541_04509 [Cyphellophora europaea CBS 101466]
MSQHTLPTTTDTAANYLVPNTPQSKSPASPSTFTTHPALTPYQIPSSGYLAAHPTITYNNQAFPIRHLAVGAIVITPPATTTTFPAPTLQPPPSSTSTSSSPPLEPTPKVLLLRRAPTDSMPNLWEVPGGAVDPTDPTILHAVARELFEESGLTAAHVGPIVGGTASRDPACSDEGAPAQVFLTRSGNLVGKWHFLVGVREVDMSGVRCDPEEHSAFVWATEAEVEGGVVAGGKMEIPFTTRDQRRAVLEGFRVWRAVGAQAQAQDQDQDQEAPALGK